MFPRKPGWRCKPVRSARREMSVRFESSPGNKFLYEYGKKRSRQKERDSKLDSHGTFNFCANHQSITAIKDIIEANKAMAVFTQLCIFTQSSGVRSLGLSCRRCVPASVSLAPVPSFVRIAFTRPFSSRDLTTARKMGSSYGIPVALLQVPLLIENKTFFSRLVSLIELSISLIFKVDSQI